MQPLVSILMPTRNREQFIIDAILSVFHQTYTHWELVILDDSTTDASQEIIQTFADFDPRIRYLKSTKPIELATKRSMLLETARGSFIGHLDDDDFLREDAIEKIMAEFARNPQCALIYSDYARIDENKNIFAIEKSPDFSQDMMVYLGYRHFTIYRKEAATHVGGFNTLIDGCEDGELFMKIAKMFECRRIPEVLYFYRSHRGNFGYQRLPCNVCKRQQVCDYIKIWKAEYAKFTIQTNLPTGSSKITATRL